MATDSKRWTSPDGGQGDETEVRRLYRRPAFPVSEQESSREDEGEDEDEVDHDGDHHQVRGHVPLLPDLVEGEPLGLPVDAGGQLGVPPPCPAPPAEDPAVQPAEGDGHPVTDLEVGQSQTLSLYFRKMTKSFLSKLHTRQTLLGAQYHFKFRNKTHI